MVVGPMIADVFDMEVAGDLCSVIPLTDIDNDAADTRLAVPTADQFTTTTTDIS